MNELQLFEAYQAVKALHWALVLTDDEVYLKPFENRQAMLQFANEFDYESGSLILSSNKNNDELMGIMGLPVHPDDDTEDYRRGLSRRITQ